MELRLLITRFRMVTLGLRRRIYRHARQHRPPREGHISVFANSSTSRERNALGPRAPPCPPCCSCLSNLKPLAKPEHGQSYRPGSLQVLAQLSSLQHLTPRDPKLSHRKVTLNAYPPAEDLEKHCFKKLEAASADVVEDEVQTPLLICLKDVVQLLENGDPAKCMFLGEVKTLGPHYKVNFTVDLVLLGAHERTTRLVLA